MTILAMVNAEKEGQIESKMMKARQLEEIRQAKHKEMEARHAQKKSKLVCQSIPFLNKIVWSDWLTSEQENAKESIRQKKGKGGDKKEAESTAAASKPKAKKKSVGFA